MRGTVSAAFGRGSTAILEIFLSGCCARVRSNLVLGVRSQSLIMLRLKAPGRLLCRLSTRGEAWAESMRCMPQQTLLVHSGRGYLPTTCILCFACHVAFKTFRAMAKPGVADKITLQPECMFSRDAEGQNPYRPIPFAFFLTPFVRMYSLNSTL